MNFSNVIAWGEGHIPKAPEGFTVTRYADGFDNHRWLYVLLNGDVLVAESNSNHSLGEKKDDVRTTRWKVRSIN